MKKILSVIIVFSLMLVPLESFAQKSPDITVTSEYLSDNMFENDISEDEESAVNSSSLTVDCKAAILMDVETNTVLFEMNSNERLAPASITKIMSMLLVVEAIEQGKIDLNDNVICTENASSLGGSQIWLEPGESMTVHELLKAAAVGSANDAITLLGEHIYGSDTAFVSAMNNKARILNLKNTNFVNCTGLDAPEHYTSAYDIAIMSAELIKHELIKEYTTIWIDYLRDGKTQLVNTNKLVRFYEGTTGLKTGTTDKAGYCLSATAQRDSLNLVAVILAAKDSKERFNGVKRMLNYGFSNWTKLTLTPDPELLRDVAVRHGVVKSVSVEADEISGILVEKGTEKEYSLTVTLEEETVAPVAEGQPLGVVSLLKGSECIKQYNICAKNSVNKLGFFGALVKLLKNLVNI